MRGARAHRVDGACGHGRECHAGSLLEGGDDLRKSVGVGLGRAFDQEGRYDVPTASSAHCAFQRDMNFRRDGVGARSRSLAVVRFEVADADLENVIGWELACRSLNGGPGARGRQGLHGQLLHHLRYRGGPAAGHVVAHAPVGLQQHDVRGVEAGSRRGACDADRFGQGGSRLRDAGAAGTGGGSPSACGTGSTRRGRRTTGAGFGSRRDVGA